jgi:hypothetical protein
VQSRLRQIPGSVLFPDTVPSDNLIERLIESFQNDDVIEMKYNEVFFEYSIDNLYGVAKADNQDMAQVPVIYVKGRFNGGLSEFSYHRDGSYFTTV